MASLSTSKDDEASDDFKLHISRVPTKFDEATVQRILEEKLSSNDASSSAAAVVKVELVYPHDDEEENNEYKKKNDNKDEYDEHGNPYNDEYGNPYNNPYGNDQKAGIDATKEHRGFGFVSLASADILEQALALQSIKGGRKPTSKRQHTMYLRPYVAKPDDENGDETTGTTNAATSEQDERSICYLWSSRRCPYGDACKFNHVGEGGCLVTSSQQQQVDGKRRAPGKCFSYKTKGRCDRGETCPFSHDCEPTLKKPKLDEQGGKKKDERPKSEKDCINWKTKGTCRKGDKCVYRHDVDVQKVALKKLKKKKKNNKKQQQQA